MDSKDFSFPPNSDPATVGANVLPRNGLPLKAIPVLFAVSGLILILWAGYSQLFRDNENSLAGIVCLPIAAGIASVVLGLTFQSHWQRSGCWFALALFGQAVNLQLVDAGPHLHYQHYLPLNETLTKFSSLLFAFLILQTFFVLFGIGFRWKQIWVWGKQNLRLWQLFLLGAVFFIAGTTVSENISFYFYELVFAGFVQTVNLGNILLIGLAIPRESLQKLLAFFQKLFGNYNTEAEPGMPDRFSVILAVWVIVVASLLNIFSYERHPHVPDEVIYLTQARFFANGSLKMPAPPVPEAFEVFLMKVEGNQWYPTTPPGWAMILAIGSLLGVPWLVNPLLAGLNLLLTYIFIRELYSKQTARISIFLLAVSPWYIFLAMSFMTHIFTLTSTLLAMIGVAWARRKGKSAWAFSGGLALGMIALIRPLEAVAIAGLLGLWAIGFGGKRLKLSGIAGLIFGSIITGGVGLAYNFYLTGNPLVFPINAYTDEHFGANANAYGFGPDRGMGWAIDPNPGHGPIDALINTNLNVSTLNTELFGWGIGSFLFIAAFFCFGKLKRGDYLMLMLAAVIYGLHFFYYFSGGPDFSARYWFLMIVPLIVFSAKGIQQLGIKLKEQSAEGNVRLYAVIMVLCFTTLVNFIPWRAVDKYHNFRGMRPDIRYLADTNNFAKSLVLIRGNMHPDYDSAMIYNPLDFQADVPIYAWDRDAMTRRKLLEVYGDRPVWIVNSPSLTKRGFEVAAGPLKAQDLLEEYENKPN